MRFIVFWSDAMYGAKPALKVALARVAAAAVITIVAAGVAGPVSALELREELLPNGRDRIAQDEPAAGESVGEPAAEDAPVEGEPSAGEAAVVPPDEEPVDDGTPPPSAQKPADGAAQN